MRRSANELASTTTSPAAPRRPARLSTVLVFGAAFMIVALVPLEKSRRAPQIVLTVVGPYAGLAIMAVIGFISGALFFSSPTMGLRVRAHATPGTAEPLWLTTAEVVSPFFVLAFDSRRP